MPAHKFIGKQGEAHHGAKLTADKVREMRRLHEEVGLCIKCISIIHKVAYPTAWEAISYRTWKSVI